VDVLEALWKLDKDFGILDSSDKYLLETKQNGKIQFANNKPQVET
jgi:hypothetical protein